MKLRLCLAVFAALLQASAGKKKVGKNITLF